jgi:peptide chain release factor
MNRLLITSGRGPAECRIAVRQTMAVMIQEAETIGLEIDFAVGPEGDRHGPSSAIALITGVGAMSFTQNWVGSILWVAQSPIRPHHKRKNWFVGVFELPTRDLRRSEIKPSDIRFETFRAGGPGGQHQNKTESAVRAIYIPTGVAVIAREGRSQHRNKANALARLAAVLDASTEIANAADRVLVQSGHDKLERGKPIRNFIGARFL